MTERATPSGSFPKYKVGDSGTFNNRRPLNPSVGAVYKTGEKNRRVMINSSIKFDVTADDEYTMPPALNITTSYYDGISGYGGFVSPPAYERGCCEDGNSAPKKIALAVKVNDDTTGYVNFDGRVKYDATMMNGDLKRATKSYYY